MPKDIKATLEAPEPDDTCPISHESISSLELDFLPPNSVFMPGRPELACMRLACGHKFNALHITYHFARNQTVQCPVCRAGPQARIQNKAIPPHLRRRIVRRAKSEQSKDRDALIEADVQVAREIQGSPSADLLAITFMRQFVTHFVEQGCVCLEIRYPNEQATLNQLTSHYHSGPYTVFICRMGNDGAVPPTNGERFIMLGGIRVSGIPTRFPASDWTPPQYPNPLRLLPFTQNVSRPGSVIKYYVTTDSTGIVCLTWSIPTHFFYLMSQPFDE